MSLRQITRESAAAERGRRHPYMTELGRPLLAVVLLVGVVAGLGWVAVKVAHAIGGASLDLSAPSLPALTFSPWLALVPMGIVAAAWWLRPSARLNRQIRRF